MTTVHKIAPIFILGKLVMESSLLLIVFFFCYEWAGYDRGQRFFLCYDGFLYDSFRVNSGK
jgi:hypothetical protein